MAPRKYAFSCTLDGHCCSHTWRQEDTEPWTTPLFHKKSGSHWRDRKTAIKCSIVVCLAHLTGHVRSKSYTSEHFCDKKDIITTGAVCLKLPKTENENVLTDASMLWKLKSRSSIRDLRILTAQGCPRGNPPRPDHSVTPVSQSFWRTETWSWHIFNPNGRITTCASRHMIRILQQHLCWGDPSCWSTHPGSLFELEGRDCVVSFWSHVHWVGEFWFCFRNKVNERGSVEFLKYVTQSDDDMTANYLKIEEIITISVCLSQQDLVIFFSWHFSPRRARFSIVHCNWSRQWEVSIQ